MVMNTSLSVSGDTLLGCTCLRRTTALVVGMAMQFLLLSVLSEAISDRNIIMSAISGRKNLEAILRIYSLLVVVTLEDEECKRTI